MTGAESARYWAAKKAQHQRALDFLAEARPGDTYRIERYALPQTGIPHELSEDADACILRNATPTEFFALMAAGSMIVCS